MKIKNDFVTNSSSASFILKIKPKTKLTLDEFSKQFNEYLESYMKAFNDKMHFWNPNFIEEDGIFFKIEDFISMYNDIYDIPKYLRHIIIEDKVGLIDWFDVVSLTVIDEH